MGARRSTALAALALVPGLLAGCSFGDDGPEIVGPDFSEVSEQLADGLSRGKLGRVPYADGVTALQAKDDYDAVLEGMGGLDPIVIAAGTGPLDEETLTVPVTLSWQWPVGEQEWSYETDLSLELEADRWVVPWSRALIEPSLADGDVLELRRSLPERADIRGAGGLALVADRPVVRFGIDRSQVGAVKAGAAARRLAQLLGIDAKSYAERVTAAGDLAFVEGIVYRRDEVPSRVLGGYDRIPGALAVTGELPLAPSREFAAPILGRVGEVTAEMIEKEPDLYSVGDRAGVSGLQARYDEQLRGTPGVTVVAVPSAEASGDESSDGGSGEEAEERELFREPPVKGRPLKLTLDIDLQLAAERLLAGVGPASALVALRPSDGHVLAAANGPGNDGYNMATFGQFAPGSTFKAVSSLALLRAGLTPESTVRCTDSVVVDGKRFENYDDYPASGLGRISLRTAIANSCNTALIAAADRLGEGDLADAAASLGLGVDHDLGFPAYFGQVEPPASATQKAADMIGQGKVLASPMAMAAVVGSVQSGKTVLPRLVKGWSQRQQAAPELTGQEAAALRDLLRAVVTSGSGRFLADVPGQPVIGKTGTAEFERDGRLRNHAWMVAAQGDLAVAVFVEEGQSGSGTAGPILEAFLRQVP
ncbi:penicillin-binding transpeptidase domain-containing protein [Nocardioides sp. GCM10027113]|uniref:penicillin-binding transpeptidase domain-containing protein n=1 Tax=unclassified Nocardioides TaxID=2615069 RepID=UPI003611F1D3